MNKVAIKSTSIKRDLLERMHKEINENRGKRK